MRLSHRSQIVIEYPEDVKDFYNVPGLVGIGGGGDRFLQQR
jgi:hypothetical protein